ncbi:MAG: hydrogenase maturation protease [bacterium]
MITLKTKFKDILKGKVVILGLGNTLRGDDGFGPAVIGMLKDKINAVCYDAGTTPENYIGKICKDKPDSILIIDTGHIDCNPGEYKLLQKADILQSGLNTHTMSPVMFIEHLEKGSNAQVHMLCVQPVQIQFGSEMSDAVKKSLFEVVMLIKESMYA